MSAPRCIHCEEEYPLGNAEHDKASALVSRNSELEAALRWALRTLEPPTWTKVNIDPDHTIFDKEYAAAKRLINFDRRSSDVATRSTEEPAK